MEENKLTEIDAIKLVENKYGPISPSKRDKDEYDFRSYTAHFNLEIIKKLRELAQDKHVSLTKIFNEAIAYYLLINDGDIEPPTANIKQKDLKDVISPIINEVTTSNDAVKKELESVKAKLEAVFAIFGSRLN